MPHRTDLGQLRGLPVASGSIGLMAKDISSVELVFKTLLESEPWRDDPNVIELPWRAEKHDAIAKRAGASGYSSGRLVLGLMACDQNVQPHPNVARALEHVKETLEKEGHEIVDWNPPPHPEAVENLLKIFGSAAGPAIVEAIKASGEPPIAQIRTLFDQPNVTSNSTAEFWDLCQRREEYKQAYAAYWAQMGGCSASGRAVDGVVLPVAPTSAARAGEFHYLAYSAIANVLDLPAVAFSVAREGYSDAKAFASPSNLSKMDEVVKRTYREDDAQNMPVGLQVICPRLQEECALALATIIEQALHARAHSAHNKD